MTGQDKEGERLAELAGLIHHDLIESRHSTPAGGHRDLAVKEAIRQAVERRAAVLAAPTREALIERVARDTIGLGPLEDLLDDPLVEEVMINGGGEVYVERFGKVEKVEAAFAGEVEFRNTIERILAPLGRRVDELSPMVDARLADGSRVNVIIPPLAVDGPAVSIRRFSMNRPGPEKLIELGTLTEAECRRLADAIASRRSLLISGGTGSGKTTLLNALSSFIDPSERVVTIEDAAELNLMQPHVVRLESRPASIEGRGEVSIRDLLRNSLRMRPDRIIIGEVRGGEALDLLTALNTGHDGALSTVHASSAADALARLEVLSLMAGVGLPMEAITEQLRRGIDLVCHISRMPDGSRRVTEIMEVKP